MSTINCVLFDKVLLSRIGLNQNKR